MVYNVHVHCNVFAHKHIIVTKILKRENENITHGISSNKWSKFHSHVVIVVIHLLFSILLFFGNLCTLFPKSTRMCTNNDKKKFYKMQWQSENSVIISCIVSYTIDTTKILENLSSKNDEKNNNKRWFAHRLLVYTVHVWIENFFISVISMSNIFLFSSDKLKINLRNMLFI